MDNKKVLRQQPSFNTYDPTNIDDDSLIYKTDLKGIGKPTPNGKIPTPKGKHIEMSEKRHIEDSYEPQDSSYNSNS